MITLDIGDVAELEAAITNSKSGDPVDPSAPTFKVQTPSGDVDEVDATKGATGVYTGEFICTEAGIHELLYLGSGANAAAGELRFRVREPRVPRA